MPEESPGRGDVGDEEASPAGWGFGGSTRLGPIDERAVLPPVPSRPRSRGHLRERVVLALPPLPRAERAESAARPYGAYARENPARSLVRLRTLGEYTGSALGASPLFLSSAPSIYVYLPPLAKLIFL